MVIGVQGFIHLNCHEANRLEELSSLGSLTSIRLGRIRVLCRYKSRRIMADELQRHREISQQIIPTKQARG